MSEPSDPSDATSAVVAVPLGGRATAWALIRMLPGDRLVGFVDAAVLAGPIAFRTEDLGLRDGSWTVIASADRVGDVERARLDRLAALAAADAFTTAYPATIATDDVDVLESALAVHFGVTLLPEEVPRRPQARIERLLAAYLRTPAGHDAAFLHRGDLPSARFGPAVVERLDRIGFTSGMHRLARGAAIYAVDSAPLSYPSLRRGGDRVRAVIEEFGGVYASWEAVTERGTIYASRRGEPTDLSLDVIRGTYG